MRIVYHLGAHCTDEERLLRCLLKNRGRLAQDGIAVPGPAKYRTLLRDTAIQLKGQVASDDTQALVLDQILENAEATRLILSWDNFLSYPQWVMKGAFYPAAAERLQAFTRIFPDFTAEFHLAIRNPASFLPELCAGHPDRTFATFMDGVDPAQVYWSDVVAALHKANPDVPLTVWCDEDTPLIWPEVLQAVSGYSGDTPLDDSHDLLGAIMSADGFARMNAYFATHPPASRGQRRKVVSAFLDKFALPEKIDMAVDVPGWTEDTVAQLTANYTADIARIAAMDGVTFIAA